MRVRKLDLDMEGWLIVLRPYVTGPLTSREHPCRPGMFAPALCFTLPVVASHGALCNVSVWHPVSGLSESNRAYRGTLISLSPSWANFQWCPLCYRAVYQGPCLVTLCSIESPSDPSFPAESLVKFDPSPFLGLTRFN